MSVTDRAAKVQAAVATLECDLQLLCLTGVEDKLQEDVSSSLNYSCSTTIFRFAVETAVAYSRSIHVFGRILAIDFVNLRARPADSSSLMRHNLVQA